MRVIDPGHRYELDTLDGDGNPTVMQFVKRIGDHYPGNRPPACPGTTSQEALRVALDIVRVVTDRSGYVNPQTPCVETEAAIRLLEAAIEGVIVLFEIRAKRVKGKHLEFPTVRQVVEGTCCPVCGHVDCAEHNLTTDGCPIPKATASNTDPSPNTTAVTVR